MTAKQCECWVPNGDLLVTEAEQLMEANGLDGLDAVYKHIHERGLQYVAPPPFAGGGPPAKPQRERRPSRDYVQDVSVMGFSYDELEKLRRSREASLDEASVETATTAAKRAEPARRDRRPSGDVVQGVSVMGFSLGGLEKLRKERLAAQEYEEEIAAASATSTPVSRRSRSASSSGAHHAAPPAGPRREHLAHGVQYCRAREAAHPARADGQRRVPVILMPRAAHGTTTPAAGRRDATPTR